ncbi:MAG: PHP domain-containing protein [Chloroflexi bacterium]|nr:PHP domain-containing protein [Chloroflexota bacterium]
MTAGYVELHAHSCFSLLDGASYPEALIARAAALDMPALALTDHDAMYGAVPFAKAAREAGIKPILGAELTVRGTAPHHLTVLVQNAAGWTDLCALITSARHNAPKGDALLDAHLLDTHRDGLIVLSGCRRGEIAAALRRGDHDAAARAACRYRALYGDHFYIELQRHHLPDDQRLTADLIALARELDLPVAATNNVHYAERDGHRLQDILTCIRHNITLDDARAAAPEFGVLPQVRRRDGRPIHRRAGRADEHHAHRRRVRLHAGVRLARAAGLSDAGGPKRL